MDHLWEQDTGDATDFWQEVKVQRYIAAREKLMIKVYVNTDEWYPVYSISDDVGHEDPHYFDERVELTKAQHATVVSAFKKFDKAQDILRDATRIAEEPEVIAKRQALEDEREHKVDVLRQVRVAMDKALDERNNS